MPKGHLLILTNKIEGLKCNFPNLIKATHLNQQHIKSMTVILIKSATF